uniref:X8 domain-containing protein n=1 Tax=Opuntia streptacantha TaxID=393608 RepID=A0A7C8YDK8_OPUST
MGVLVFLALFLSLIGCSRGATYCVCKDGISDSVLQKTIDYACGSGADCRPILQNGPCFQPNTVKAHCDYAANSYFQNKGQALGSCDFSQTATPTSSPPGVTGGCTYPTSPGQGTSYSTGTPTTTIGGTPGSTTTGIFSPTGMGPTGMDTTNPSGGSSLLQRYRSNFFFVTRAILMSSLLLLWG